MTDKAEGQWRRGGHVSVRSRPPHLEDINGQPFGAPPPGRDVGRLENDVADAIAGLRREDEFLGRECVRVLHGGGVWMGAGTRQDVYSRMRCART